MRLVDLHAPAEDVAPSGPEVLLSGWPATLAEALIAGLRRRGVAARVVAPAELASRGDLVVSAPGPGEAGGLALTLDGAPYFVSSRPLSVDDTVELLHAAWKRAVRPAAAMTEDDGRVPDLLRRLGGETDLWSATRAIAHEARGLADATQAQVWILDENDRSLLADDRRESASSGITSYVARTARSVAVERPDDDPRYDAALDGDAGERFLGAPVAFDDRVLGVLTLRRPPHAAPFTDAEQKRVEHFTDLVAPSLARLVLDRQLEQRHAAIRADVAQLYRGEALEQYQRGRTDEGHMLEIEPHWTRHAYRVLVALLAAALVFSAFVHVDRYAEGVGIVRDGHIVGVVAARHRAELRPGLPLRFEHSAAPLTVTSVNRRIIAATDARQLLGADGPRLWTTTDPAVRIDAAISAGDFGDGVTGRVRVRLGRERLLLTWVRRG